MARVLLFLVLLAAFSFGQGASIPGIWTGILDVGVAKLHLVLHADSPGHPTLDSIEQRAMGMPIDEFHLDGTRVSFSLSRIGASFQGEFTENGTRIQGMFKQGGKSLPLSFERTESALAVPRRPQTPQPPFPYKSEDVTFPSVAKEITLAGTLTIPAGAGPFPGVVMITGSGPQDRDETLMGHKPFWVTADYLSRHGVAVLRVDDRGVGKSGGNYRSATAADFADDAEGAATYLRARKEIGRVGLIGHSEGGMIAPVVANRSHDVNFVVLLAGTAVPGDQVIIEQQRLILKAMGQPDGFIEKYRDLERQVIAIAKSETDTAVAQAKMRDAAAGLPAEARQASASQFEQAATPWFHYFVNYDPAPALRNLKQPVLALNGALDTQVSAAQNLPAIAAALEAGGNPDYQIVKLPGLNHLFQTAKTGAPSEYSAIEETMAPVVLDIVSGWILRHQEVDRK